jgi:hypothetical protein
MKKEWDEEKIAELVRSFEECSIPRGEWRHAEHLIVALYLIEEYGLNEAIARMRSGLLSLLRSHGVDLEREMPYNETLTVFWMRTVYAYSLIRNGDPLSDKANGLVAAFSKDFHQRFIADLSV